MTEGDRKVDLPIKGAEARALDLAADHLEGIPLKGKDKKRVADHMRRLVARYRVRA